MKNLSIIVAVDELGGFGKDGKIPWHLHEDLKRFKDTTTGQVCIMGKNTYLDIRNRRPIVPTVNPVPSPDEKISTEISTTVEDLLPNRKCYVISKSLFNKQEYSANMTVRLPGNMTAKDSLSKAVQDLGKNDNREIFIIGGEKLFIEAWPWTTKIYMTVVKGEPFDCDRFFPIKLLNEDFKIDTGTQTDKVYNITYRRIKA